MQCVIASIDIKKTFKNILGFSSTFFFARVCDHAPDGGHVLQPRGHPLGVLLRPHQGSAHGSCLQEGQVRPPLPAHTGGPDEGLQAGGSPVKRAGEGGRGFPSNFFKKSIVFSNKKLVLLRVILF